MSPDFIAYGIDMAKISFGTMLGLFLFMSLRRFGFFGDTLKDPARSIDDLAFGLRDVREQLTQRKLIEPAPEMKLESAEYASGPYRGCEHGGDRTFTVVCQCGAKCELHASAKDFR